MAALGGALLADAPRPRALVALRCSLTIESVAAHLGLLAAGHVPLLLEADLAPDLAGRIAALYRVDAVLDPQSGWAVRGEGPALHPDLALLLTTSGSTGSPKLVRQSRAGVRANADAIAASLDLGPAERPYLHLPMSYSYGLSVIHSHLVVGACTCLTRASVMEPGYWEGLRAHAATSIAGVPFHYTALRRLLDKADVPSLRTLTQAGGRMEPKLVAFFAEWAARTGRRFVVMYGQTEAGPRISLLPPERAANAPHAIGLPIPGVTVRLVDDNGTETNAGELIVESAGVMMGYALGPDDLAKGDELRGRLATGDLAERGEDGLLRIVGRKSRILKIYGLRLNVDEVEARVAALGVRAVCFGQDDALRVLIEDESDPAALRARLVELFSLPPRGIEVRRAAAPLERAASGKLAAAARDAAWEAAVSAR